MILFVGVGLFLLIALSSDQWTRLLTADAVEVPDAQDAAPVHLFLCERLVVREGPEELKAGENNQ